jgi:hypothetical protein
MCQSTLEAVRQNEATESNLRALRETERALAALREEAGHATPVPLPRSEGD